MMTDWQTEVKEASKLAYESLWESANIMLVFDNGGEQDQAALLSAMCKERGIAVLASDLYDNYTTAVLVECDDVHAMTELVWEAWFRAEGKAHSTPDTKRIRAGFRALQQSIAENAISRFLAAA
jgi:hypothetical protein